MLATKIKYRYGSESLRKSALNIRDGENVFKEILEGKGYKTILEIGTYKGISSACMAQYCDKVITIDLVNGQLEKAGDNFSRKELWEFLGLNNIELVLVNNNKEKEDYINSIEFDFAFVDGAHDKTVVHDFELVKKCGNVLFHDYSDNGKNAVYDFVNTLGNIKVYDNIFALWTK